MSLHPYIFLNNYLSIYVYLGGCGDKEGAGGLEPRGYTAQGGRKHSFTAQVKKNHIFIFCLLVFQIPYVHPYNMSNDFSYS